MNFDFDLNALIPFEITKFDSDLRVLSGNNGESQTSIQLNRDHRHRLAQIIDRIGEASSKAQGLKEIITSYRKFSLNDRHRIYLMKANTSSNNTSLVGMIKVGEKRLFVFDHMGKYHEMSPLCVLDFYVHESQQRRGFGRKLFDYMLASEQVRPEHLAIDSPSEKCTRFLKKHYGFKQPIPQNNNFVVFPGFFENRPITIMRRGHMSNGVSDRKTETYSAMPYYNRIEDLPPLNHLEAQRYIHRTGSVDSRVHRNDLINQNDRIGVHPVNNINHQLTGVINNHDQTRYNQPAREFLAEKTHSMYDILAHSKPSNPYDPFPSLKKLIGSNSAAPVLTRPSIPPRSNQESPLANYYQLPNSNNRNIYDPFPSLRNLPEFYSSPSYLNGKFKKTRLW